MVGGILYSEPWYIDRLTWKCSRWFKERKWLIDTKGDGNTLFNENIDFVVYYCNMST